MKIEKEHLYRIVLNDDEMDRLCHVINKGMEKISEHEMTPWEKLLIETFNKMFEELKELD
jgi:hypothetical protein